MSDLVESFVAATNASKYLAEQYLDRNNQDLGAAIEDYYSSRGEPKEAGTSENEPLFPRRKPNKAGGIRTLRDLGADADDQDDNTDTKFFTGGEKLALQVENPDKNKNKNKIKNANKAGREPSLVERIFQRASEQMAEEDDRPSAKQDENTQPSSKFTGTGFRLGDSTQALEVIEDRRNASHVTPSLPLKVTRQITFWRQGFTVGEGLLRRYDDSENILLLQELKQGRVPVSLLDVEFGQDVDVSVVRKLDEDYVPPKRSMSGFHGQGQRLGSPVPGEDLGSIVASLPLLKPEGTEKSGDSPSFLSSSKAPRTPLNKESECEGDSLVQIRFANGKRVSRKFNGLDPVSAVYAFVRGHENTENQQRPFMLSHTFPVKPIEEDAELTVDLEKLKNAVIVQRWK